MSDPFAEFDAAVGSTINNERSEGARQGFAAAVGTDPDSFAEAQRVARRTGVPVDTAINMPAEIKKQDRIGSIDFDTLAKTSPATASLLADVGKAKIAHDDVEGMGRLETAVMYLGRNTVAGVADLFGAGAKILDEIQPFTTSDRDLAVLYKNDPEGLKRAREENSATFLSRFARRMTAYSADTMKDLTPEEKATYGGLEYATTDTADAAYLSPVKLISDAVRSLPTTAALALTTYLTRGQAITAERQALAAGATAEAARAAGIKAAVDMASKFGAASEGTIGYAQQALSTQHQVEGMAQDKLAASPEYQALIEQGYDPSAARIYIAAKTGEQAGVGAGVVDATTNFIGGRFLGKIIGEGGSVGVRFGKGFANEAAVETVQSGGEQLAQNLAIKNTADPSQSLSEGTGESMLQGLFVGGLTGGSMSAVLGRERKAQAAEEDAQVIGQLNELARASKVLQRDPQAFSDFIEQAAEGGPVQEVFIDANMLMQSGVADQVAAASPTVASQLQTALQTGGMIAIPVEEYATNIAATEYAQSLAPHLKTNPDGYSQAEAQEYMQSHAQQLEEEVRRVLAEKEADTAFRESSDAVREILKTQLDTANRFTPQVNDAYATLVGNFFTTTAAKLGTTPEALYERFPLRVGAQRMEGVQFEQSAPESLDAVRRQWSDAGIENFISESKGTISLSQIVVPKSDRNTGKGTAAMQALVDYADRTGQRIVLSPSGDFGGSKKRLIDFYKRFGFVENKGKTKDFTTMESMYRAPKSLQQSPTSPKLKGQGSKAKRDEYTTDLFGIPADRGADNDDGQPIPGRRGEGGLSRDDAPGTYASRTELVEENTRELGADKVTTPEEAAQALAYLGRGAVERLDALITDAEGNPLAIVGAFKGALAQASVYPATVAGEAFRVAGAAHIWFAHNHPSGNPALSNADRMLSANLTNVFRGSEITPHGIFAIGGKEGDGRIWMYEPAGGGIDRDLTGTTSAPTSGTTVPVVERVYADSEGGRLGPSISSPLVAKDEAKRISGGEPGVILTDAQNAPIAFVPVNPSEIGELRRDGRMDALYRAISIANAGGAFITTDGFIDAADVKNLAAFFNSIDVRVLDVLEFTGDTTGSWSEQGKNFAGTTFYQNQEAPRGTFSPSTLSITLLKGADLSTFLHETGHFFLEVQAHLADQLQKDAEIFGIDSLKPSEREIIADHQAVLDWFGVKNTAEWNALDFEEKRSYHEQFARGFEAYLMEGNAPSIELQGLFQRFRAWMLSVYKELKALNVELNDEVRAVFDRMLATNEQIILAEQGRSMMPLLVSPEQSGMTPEQFAEYQALGNESTQAAVEDLQSRGVRDMKWLNNARSRMLKKLQREARETRASVQAEVRADVMRQPIYRAWTFLTAKITAENKLTDPAAPKSGKDTVDPAIDSLFVAIAKLGGINRPQLETEWGMDPKESVKPPVFGKPVIRAEGKGLSLDQMAEALAEEGYLSIDRDGKWDLREFEEKFNAELRGETQYSNAYDPALFAEVRPGEQVANPSALTAGRFDRASLVEIGLPEEIIGHLEKLRMVRKTGGIHADIVADMFGYGSGDELARSLAAAEAPRAEIEGLTDAAMLERYGDLSSDAEIAKAADKAIHNDVRARLLATEANTLEQALGQRKTLASAARAFARSTVNRLKVRHIRPGQYASAAERASRNAQKAITAGDIQTAAAEKRNQLIQHYATRAAYDAQEEVEKGLRYLKKFDGEVKIDADYADQIHAILERFDLRKQSLKAIDKRSSLAKWLEAQREAGFEPDIPDEVKNEALRMSYKNLTVEEFRGLVDSIKQIEHLGRLKHKLLTAHDQRAFETIRDEIAGSIRENAQGREAETRTPSTYAGKVAQQLKRYWAAHIKAGTWARVMDGGKDGGPVWEYIMRSANERGDMETSMRAEATARLSEILAPVFAAGKMGGKGTFFKSIGRSLNREQRLAIALNTGNEGNLQRLLGGEGWSMGQITPVLQSLTAAEWRTVQEIWDHMESYRSEIDAKERRVYGRGLNAVEATPFTVATADGQTIELRGGYYPIKYDPAASQRAEEHADAEGAKRELQGAYTSATTRRSFTKARAEEVNGRPLLYSLAGVYSGVNDVIHDLAWHEWLIDANRLLRSNAIDSAMREHYGPEAKAQFKSWAADIAEGDKGADNAGEVALSRLRQGVSIAGLGFNVVSAAMQPLGLTQSITRVGAKWVGRGVSKYIAHPIDLTREVNSKSSFMENRARTRFRELNELRNRVEERSKTQQFMGEYGYLLMMRFQQAVDVPTWWGAYEKAVAGGADEARAVALADQAVIDSQGGGQTKDLSAVERGGPALKLFTVFYSFMNTAFNLGVERTMSNKPGERGKLAADYLMLFVIPAVLSAFIKDALTPGDSGDEELDELAKKIAASQIDYLMGQMVIVREFSGAAKLALGLENYAQGYQGPAGTRLIGDTFAWSVQAQQGEIDNAFLRTSINLAGSALGLPSAQINRTIKGTTALVEGETSNPAAIVFGFQKPK